METEELYKIAVEYVERIHKDKRLKNPKDRLLFTNLLRFVFETGFARATNQEFDKGLVIINGVNEQMKNLGKGA